MYRDRDFFESLVNNIKEDIRKEDNFITLEKHLVDVNETITEKYSILELKQICNCLKNAVKDITNNSEKYLCAGIIVLYELVEAPELFMSYTKGDYPLR